MKHSGAPHLATLGSEWHSQARRALRIRAWHSLARCIMDKETCIRLVQLMKKVRIAYREDALAFKHGWIYEVHWNLRWMFRDHHVVMVIG